MPDLVGGWEMWTWRLGIADFDVAGRDKGEGKILGKLVGRVVG